MKDLHDRETRVTSATGGQKGMKLTQLGALDPAAIIELSRVAGMGAMKYDSFNYLKGYDWSLSFNAMMRHALLFWSGEDTDRCTVEAHPIETHDYTEDCNGSGLSHMAHAAWMALCLVSFAMRGIGTDDRYVQRPSWSDFARTNDEPDLGPIEHSELPRHQVNPLTAPVPPIEALGTEIAESYMDELPTFEQWIDAEIRGGPSCPARCHPIEASYAACVHHQAAS